MSGNRYRFFSKLHEIQGVVEKTASHLSSAIILCSMFLITIDVVMRYIFNSPIQGVYNVIELMMVGIVYLAVASVQSHREHVKVEFFTQKLPQKAQGALDIFGNIVGLFIFSVITWQGAKLAWRSWVEKDYSMGVVHVPYWPGKWAFTIGLGLLCLRLVSHIVSDFLALLRPTYQPSANLKSGE